MACPLKQKTINVYKCTRTLVVCNRNSVCDQTIHVHILMV